MYCTVLHYRMRQAHASDSLALYVPISRKITLYDTVQYSPWQGEVCSQKQRGVAAAFANTPLQQLYTVLYCTVQQLS